jgi:hypothetical protein
MMTTALWDGRARKTPVFSECAGDHFLNLLDAGVVTLVGKRFGK